MTKWMLLVALAGLVLLGVAGGVWFGQRAALDQQTDGGRDGVLVHGGAVTVSTPDYGGRNPAVRSQLINKLQIKDIGYTTMRLEGKQVDVAEVVFSLVWGGKARELVVPFVESVRLARQNTTAGGFEPSAQVDVREAGWRRGQWVNVGFFYTDTNRPTPQFEAVVDECAEAGCGKYVTLGFGSNPIESVEAYLDGLLATDKQNSIVLTQVVPGYVYVLAE
jgi:hypothetical protein